VSDFSHARIQLGNKEREQEHDDKNANQLGPQSKPNLAMTTPSM
jgi:hypothetical protein